MKGPAFLHTMPRAASDFKECIDFVDRQPWGKPLDRERDIKRAVIAICRWPTLARVQVRRPGTGVEFRRREAAQFAVIYAYFPPSEQFKDGLVSLRAIRHRRVRNVFDGVREPEAPAYGEEDGEGDARTPAHATPTPAACAGL